MKALIVVLAVCLLGSVAADAGWRSKKRHHNYPPPPPPPPTTQYTYCDIEVLSTDNRPLAEAAVTGIGCTIVDDPSISFMDQPYNGLPYFSYCFVFVAATDDLQSLMTALDAINCPAFAIGSGVIP